MVVVKLGVSELGFRRSVAVCAVGGLPDLHLMKLHCEDIVQYD